MAAPTAVPVKPLSEIGVLITLSGPNSSKIPLVSPKVPVWTSSPSGLLFVSSKLFSESLVYGLKKH